MKTNFLKSKNPIVLTIGFLMILCLLSNITHADDTVMEIISLNSRTASELSTIISPLLEESERIIATSSNLIIKATPQRLTELKKLINQLDIPLNNLSITVLQTRTKTAQGLNASADIRLRIPTHPPSKLSGHIGGRFAQTEGFNNSDNSQVIKTLDGQVATIRTGVVYPVQNVSIYDSGFGQPSFSSNTELIETSTGFRVTPRLTGNQVTLEIAPWSEQLTNRGSIDINEAMTTLRVNLGEWVEIGGINEKSTLSRNGTLAHSYSTKSDKQRLLIKVEKD